MRLRLGFLQSHRTPSPVHPLGGVQVPRVDAQPRGLVGHLALLVEGVLRLARFPGHPVPDDHLLVLDGFGAVALEPVGDCHAALGRGLRRGIGGRLDEPLDDRPRGRVSALRVQPLGLPSAVDPGAALSTLRLKAQRRTYHRRGYQ